jgi:hypothetical protein
MTNDERAAYGNRAIEAGTPDLGQNGDDHNGRRTDAIDAITNIMHAIAKTAEATGTQIQWGPESFAITMLDSARMHFEAERTGDDR